MKTIVLILVIAIGIGVSIRAKWERAAGETAQRSIATERSALRENLARERQRLQNARDARAAVSIAPRKEAAGNPTSGTRQLSPETALASHPALLAEYRQGKREAAEWGFGHMFGAVGFSPEQIEQWKQLVAEDAQRRIELIAALETQGVGRNSEAFMKLQAENEKRRRATEAEILGGLEPKYREYQSLDGTRSLVEWLTRTAVYSDEPITGDQVERATRVLAANTHEVRGSANRQGAPVIDWTAAAGPLKDVLSPTQIATLQTLATQFDKIGNAARRVEERTKLLTAEFKSKPAP